MTIVYRHLGFAEEVLERITSGLQGCLNSWIKDQASVELIPDFPEGPVLQLLRGQEELLMELSGAESLVHAIVASPDVCDAASNEAKHKILACLLDDVAQSISGKIFKAVTWVAASKQSPAHGMSVVACKIQLRASIVYLRIFPGFLLSAFHDQGAAKRSLDILQLLNQEPVHAVASFGKFRLALADLFRLAPGDIVMSNNEIDVDFELIVNERSVALAKLAKSDVHKAIVIK